MDRRIANRGWVLGITLVAAVAAQAAGTSAKALEKRIAKDLRGLEVPTMRVEDLGRGADPILVDVRPKEERKVSTIPGAITVDSLDRMPVQTRKGKVVVAFCTIGLRSGRWVEERRAQGENAFNLHGGVLAWAHAGRTFEARDFLGSTPTRQVHVYGRRWNLLPDGYQGVW
jgi:rhodanese-related sulfurtransferase